MTTPIYRPGLSELIGDQPLTPAERRLLDDCQAGETAVLGIDQPNRPEDRRMIRAALIRYLLLGGCDEAGGVRPSPKGVSLMGAYVSGTLDFQDCTTDLGLSVQDCWFDQAPSFMDARLEHLNFSGCYVPGLNGQRLGVTGSLYLRHGFVSEGRVDLRGSVVGGQLSFSGARLQAGRDGRALDCGTAYVRRSVFIGRGFVAAGEVSLSGANIEGTLDCSGGRIGAKGRAALSLKAARLGSDVLMGGGFEAEGELDLQRVQITGNLDLDGAVLHGGLIGNGMRVDANFVLRGVRGDISQIDLLDASVGKLHDDAASWQVADMLRLTDFHYAALDGGMSVRERLDWLSRNFNRRVRSVRYYAGGELDFDPHAYTQLARVLHAQGHRRVSAQILFEREKQLRRAGHARAYARLDGTWSNAWFSLVADLRYLIDGLFGMLFGYGHRPMRGLFAAVTLYLAATAFYAHVYRVGQMAPSPAPILVSAEWQSAVREGCLGVKQDGCELPLHIWEAESQSARDFETFSAGLYGLDLFVPIINLGQQDAWSPTTTRGAWGEWGFHLRWFFQAMGWVLTAVGAAVLTGLIGRRD